MTAILPCSRGSKWQAISPSQVDACSIRCYNLHVRVGNDAEFLYPCTGTPSPWPYSICRCSIILIQAASIHVRTPCCNPPCPYPGFVHCSSISISMSISTAAHRCESTQCCLTSLQHHSIPGPLSCYSAPYPIPCAFARHIHVWCKLLLSFFSPFSWVRYSMQCRRLLHCSKYHEPSLKPEAQILYPCYSST